MSLLNKVTKGVIEKPHFVLLYGEPGLGKSTFGSKAPSPIFLCTEDGTNQLDVSRLKINSFDEMIGALKELGSEKHDFKSVVIDTVDSFEPMVWDEVLKTQTKYDSIEKVPYAKGYIYALDHWNKFLDEVSKIRNKGINVVLLAHSFVKAHNDPQLEEAYDRHQIKLHHKAASLLTDQVDSVLFSTYKVFFEKKDSGKNKAYGDGSRVIYTENRPSFVAKNRFNLPFEMPLDWDEYESSAKSQAPRDTASVVKYIEDNIIHLNEATRVKAQEHFDKNKDNPVVLAQIENRIKTILSTKAA